MAFVSSCDLDDAASKGLGLVDSNLSMIGRDAMQASGAFGKMSSVLSTGIFLGLAAAFVAFAAAIALAVDNAVKFQTILIQMGRAGNLTAEQMTALGQTLMDVGGHSIFSIEELGQAFVVLLQRGVSAADIMKLVGQQAVYLAEATGMKAVPAAQLLASTLISFNIPASQAAKTVDLLQFAIEHGIGPSDTLASAMSMLGAVASVLHLSLDSMIPSFDVLARATGSYSQAAVGLQYFLNQLKNGTAIYKAEIKLLGISFYDAQGNFVGLTASLQILYNVLKDKTPQEAAQILGTLFNIRSGRAVQLLIEDLKSIYDLTGKLATSNDNLGVAMKRAQQAEQSAAGLWQSFRSNLQDVLTLMGGPFLSVIQPLLSRLNDMAIQLRVLMADNPKTGATFIALGLAISGTALIIILALNPLGQVVLVALAVMSAVGLLAAGLMKLVSWLQQTANSSTPLGHLLRDAASAAQAMWDWVSKVATSTIAILIQGIGNAFKFVADWVNKAIIAFQVVFDPIQKVVGVAKPLFDTFDRTRGAVLGVVAAAKPLTDAFDRASSAIHATYLVAQPLTDTFDRARGIIQSTTTPVNQLVSVFKFLKGILADIGGYINEQFKAAWQSMKPQLMDTWKNIQILGNELKPLLPILGMIALVILGVLIGALHGLVGALVFLVSGLTMVIQGVTAFVTGVVQLFMGFFKVVWGLVTNNSAMWQAGFKAMWEGIKNIFGGALTALGGLLLGSFGALLGFVMGFAHGVYSFFVQLSNNLVGHSIIPDMINAIVMWFVGLPGRVLGAIASLAGSLYSAGRNIIQNLINGIWDKLGELIATIANVANMIRSHLPFSPVKMGPLMGIENSGLTMMKMIAAGIDSGAPLVQAAMYRATGGMMGVPGMSRMGTPINMAGAGGSGAGYGGMAPTIIYLDGKVIYDNTMNRMRGDLQMNGGARAFR